MLCFPASPSSSSSSPSPSNLAVTAAAAVVALSRSPAPSSSLLVPTSPTQHRAPASPQQLHLSSQLHVAALSSESTAAPSPPAHAGSPSPSSPPYSIQRLMEPPAFRVPRSEAPEAASRVAAQPSAPAALAPADAPAPARTDDDLSFTLRLSLQGVVLSAEGDMGTLTGVQPEDVLGTPLRQLLHPHDVGVVLRLIEIAALHPDEEFTTVFRVHRFEGGEPVPPARDDAFVWIEVAGSVVVNPTTGKALAVAFRAVRKLSMPRNPPPHVTEFSMKHSVRPVCFCVVVVFFFDLSAVRRHLCSRVAQRARRARPRSRLAVAGGCL